MYNLQVTSNVWDQEYISVLYPISYQVYGHLATVCLAPETMVHALC